MLCGTDKILQNIPTFQPECEEYSEKNCQSYTHNIAMDLNNVMYMINIMSYSYRTLVFDSRLDPNFRGWSLKL